MPDARAREIAEKIELRLDLCDDVDSRLSRVEAIAAALTRARDEEAAFVLDGIEEWRKGDISTDMLIAGLERRFAIRQRRTPGAAEGDRTDG
jgi:hypothetical protein